VAVVTKVFNGVEAALYIADSGNNKIRMVELTSGLYKSVTFDSNVDPNAKLAGLTVYTNDLYACIVGAIVKYTFSTSTYLMASGTSKTLYSGSYTATGISDGALLTATYSTLNYVTRDGAGNLYVSDHDSSEGKNIDSVRRLSANMGNVTTMVGKTG